MDWSDDPLDHSFDVDVRRGADGAWRLDIRRDGAAVFHRRYAGGRGGRDALRADLRLMLDDTDAGYGPDRTLHDTGARRGQTPAPEGRFPYAAHWGEASKTGLDEFIGRVCSDLARRPAPRRGAR